MHYLTILYKNQCLGCIQYAAGPSVLNHNLQAMTDMMQSGMQKFLMGINTA